MLKTVIMAACLCALALPAQARPKHNAGACSDPIMQPCYDAGPQRRAARVGRQGGEARVVGARPSGCPHRYCGCALSLKLFGRIIPRLNLAANWLSFPRTVPADGMVAARRGHVFLLKRQISGSTWLVWDPNSGRGRIRVHARSITGFKIVNPHGSQFASIEQQ